MVWYGLYNAIIALLASFSSLNDKKIVQPGLNFALREGLGAFFSGRAIENILPDCQRSFPPATTQPLGPPPKPPKAPPITSQPARVPNPAPHPLRAAPAPATLP
ncbi:MAG: hypothetical protein NZ602_03475 [Thermoguttaceae bacterium]|nr:hypothetical protein [Thermoguttaceae bacterium]